MILYEHPLSPYAQKVKIALREATASRDALYALPDLIAQGLFKREYRDYRLEWMIKTGGLSVVLDGLAKQTIRFSPDFA